MIGKILYLSVSFLLSASLLAQSIEKSDVRRTGHQLSESRRALQSGQPGLTFQSKEIFPHVAIGGVWSSQITFVNLGLQPGEFPLFFTLPNGDPWVVEPQGVGAGDSFTINLPVGREFTLNLPSRSPTIETGWADIEQPENTTIGAHLIFTDSTPGRPPFEAVVALSSYQESDSLLPFDNTNGNNTCIAVINPSSTNPTTVAFEFRDEPGAVLANATRVLNPFAQQAFCLASEFPQLNSRRGFGVIFGSHSLLSSLGLRFLPGGAFTSFAPMSPPPTHLSQAAVVVSQIYGGGGNQGAPLRNDFIELYNRGTTSIDITGWTIQYASASGSNWTSTALSGTLLAGQYYLVQEGMGQSGVGTPLPAPDTIGGIDLSSQSGKVALVTNSMVLAGPFPAGAAIADLVGYGSANFAEGSAAAPSLTNTTALLRIGGGCIDFNNNADDFTSGQPNPRNRNSPLHPCN